MATRINVPVTHRTGPGSRFLARLWPWPLVAFFVWVFGQFVVGFISNDAVKAAGFFSPLMLITLLVLSLVCARARDIDAVRFRQVGSS